jgi:N-acyl-L-homoserine lactone synthetase
MEMVEIVAISDAQVRRIFRRAGWRFRRLGNPCNFEDTLFVAGCLEISPEMLAGIRCADGFTGPSVFWELVVLAVA